MPFSYSLLVLLVAGVLFVNGFTDAPNAITSAVCTGALRFGSAVLLAAACNTAGLLFSWRFAPMVQNTLLEMVDFTGAGSRAAMTAIAAAMAAVVLFSVGAWAFGIPTSESHALIAALTGAAAALGGSRAVSRAAWGKVLAGLLLSSAGGLAAGFFMGRLLRRWNNTSGFRSPVRGLQILTAGGLSALHGAQDGLKFVAILVMADGLRMGGRLPEGVDLSGSAAAVLLCAAVMAAGTLAGGKRIIDAVGRRMVRLDACSGTASDLAACLLLFAATAWGFPASTTHTKTCAVLGTGLAGNRQEIGLRTLGGILFAWALTFPACGLLGFLAARLLAR
ncbi:MAG: inorganic phosphate transporter [Provencibacterium sp.]|jgi:PiT family inorganic phosphate transporter|nr:inorganic phosphate transporter [Provencibacterium sp.]